MKRFLLILSAVILTSGAQAGAASFPDLTGKIEGGFGGRSLTLTFKKSPKGVEVLGEHAGQALTMTIDAGRRRIIGGTGGRGFEFDYSLGTDALLLKGGGVFPKYGSSPVGVRLHTRWADGMIQGVVGGDPVEAYFNLAQGRVQGLFLGQALHLTWNLETRRLTGMLDGKTVDLALEGVSFEDFLSILFVFPLL